MRLEDTTPKDKLSWCIKWASSLFLIAAMAVRASEGSNFLDNVLSFVGATGWFCVACMWRDRSLITLNAIAMFILLSGILQRFV
jgi:hypothetical protein